MSDYQLPEGYKKTEIGVIPEDWEVVALSELLDFRNGVNADKSAYGRGTPFINVLEVIQNTHLYISDIPGQISLQKSVIELYSVRKGDILFNRTSETQEEVGLTSVYLGDETVVFGGFVIRGQNRGFLLDYIYSGYAFRTSSIRFQIISKGQGAVRANIGQQELSKVLVTLPSLSEQRAIAQALSDVDALIATLDKLIAKKRDLKTATMQQLLTGKKRLPGFGEGKGYKESEVGLIPEDWEVVKLAEIGESLIGLTYKPENIRDHGTLVLRSSNIQNDRLVYEDNVYIDSSLPLPARVMVEKGDILICVRNGSRQLIGKCVLIDSHTVGSAFGAFMSVFRTKFSGFVFYQFQSNLIKKQINEIMGATINQITNKDMTAFQISLPSSEEEQEAIATVLSDMDNEITALESRLAKTQAIKQGMMQELLTGRTRLV